MTLDLQEWMAEINYKIEHLLQGQALLLRQQRGNKTERLREYVMEKGMINTKEVKRLLGLEGRENAIEHMRKLGHEPGFSFRVGDRSGTTSVLIYDQARSVRQQRAVIEKLVENQNSICLSDVMSALKMDIISATVALKDFHATTSGFILDLPYLRRKEIPPPVMKPVTAEHHLSISISKQPVIITSSHHHLQTETEAGGSMTPLQKT